MIVPILLALDVAATAPAVLPPPALSDIEQAVRVGRLEQAQLMIGRAMAAGVKGAQVDLILADLAFAQGKNDEALVRYQQLLAIQRHRANYTDAKCDFVFSNFLKLCMAQDASGFGRGEDHAGPDHV